MSDTSRASKEKIQPSGTLVFWAAVAMASFAVFFAIVAQVTATKLGHNVLWTILNSGMSGFSATLALYCIIRLAVRHESET